MSVFTTCLFMNLEAQIDKALAIGFELYKEKGWI